MTPAGVRIGAAQIAALAAAGIATVTCARRPAVAVITTGTELRSPGEPLRAGEIYESNGRMLEVALAAGRRRRHAAARRSRTTPLRTGRPSSERSRPTWSSAPAACRWDRTTSCAPSRRSSVPASSSGVLRCDRASRCRSRSATRRSCSACRGTRSRRSSAPSCSCSPLSGPSREPRHPGRAGSRARSPAACDETRTATTSCVPASPSPTTARRWRRSSARSRT